MATSEIDTTCPYCGHTPNGRERVTETKADTRWLMRCESKNCRRTWVIHYSHVAKPIVIDA